MKGNVIISLFMILLVLIVFASLIDEINTQISNALPYLTTSGQAIIQLIPLAIIIVMLSLAITGNADA